MSDWENLDRALSEFVRSGVVEVREDGEWLAAFANLQCEVSCSGKAMLIHLWSDEKNLTRRPRVKERTEDRIVLEVQRFGRAKPGRLEFLRTDSLRSQERIGREQFRGPSRSSFGSEYCRIKKKGSGSG